MAVIYSDERNFTEEQITELFRSVGWLSANYPERLNRALHQCPTVYTAWDDGELIGLVNAIDDGEMTAYAHYLLIKPQWQGKGIGNQLLEMLKEKYRDYLYLILIAENEPLIKYYKAHGFIQRDEQFVMEVLNK